MHSLPGSAHSLAQVLLVALGIASATPADAAWTTVNVVEPQTVSLHPAAVVKLDALVTITCHWKKVNSIQMNTDWASTKALAQNNWELPGDITLDGKKIWTFAAPAHSLPHDGKPSVVWKAKTTGVHQGTCSIDPQNTANVQSKKTLNFTINVTDVKGPSNTVGQPAQPILPSQSTRLPAPGTEGPLAPTTPKAPPDLLAAPAVTIGGIASQWGSNAEVKIDANKATAKYQNAGGLCVFPVGYVIRNQGLSPTGKFSILMKAASQNSLLQTLPSLEPMASKSGTSQLAFASGVNALVLHLDQTKLVSESNESNNSYSLRVFVTGSCLPQAGSGR